MAKLDNLNTRNQILMFIQSGGSKRDAAKLVKVSPTTLYAYMKDNPQFGLDVASAARQEWKPRREPAPPAIVAEVIALEPPRRVQQRLATGEDPVLDWDPHNARSVTEKFARIISRDGASDALIVGLGRIIAARAFANEVSAAPTGVIEVEVGPEAEPREIAEGEWRGS